MAKKKHNDHGSTEGAADAVTPATFAAPTAASTIDAPAESEVSPVVHLAPAEMRQETTLLDQVQSFLCQRADLAQKLAAEIEATEKKLIELRKTAAMLFPENVASPAKDKKPKKPTKPKIVSRDEEPAVRTAETEAA